MGKYVCKTCGVEKPEEEFRKKEVRILKSGPKVYRTCHCTECFKNRAYRYRQNNPYAWIATRYNISKEKAKYWYERSMTNCDICGKEWEEGNERLCIDHDHNTQEIRGILCKNCNHLLGHAYDKVSILENALVYLKRAGG